MPYIKKSRRKAILNNGTDELESAGDLNYFITMACLEYLNKHGNKYQTYNDIIGALEGCKLEFYDRKVSVYEAAKVVQNGDVF